MGSTVTFCRRTIDSAYVPFEILADKRSTLAAKIDTYLSEPSCVAEARDKEPDAYAEALGLYYKTLLKSELAEHGGDEIESLSSMKGLSIVISEMWAEASATLENCNAISEFDLAHIPLAAPRTRVLDESSIKNIFARIDPMRVVPADRVEAYNYGCQLAAAYAKALCELSVCARTGEIPSIKHHCGLLGDILFEMNELVQFPYKDNPVSEEFLLDSHPHAIAMKEGKS